MARRKGGRRIKRKTQKQTDTADSATDLPPRAFVFTKGSVPGKLKALVEDLKRVLSPNTATALRAQKRNKLRDFVDVAGMLHVSFFLIVSATDKNSYLRLVRCPRGPTLTFRITGFSLGSDLAATQRKPYSASHSIWQSAPMLVLSNFDRSVQHEALSATMLQNLFPTLNVATARLASFRRVVLIHQLPEAEGGGCELRQYVIKAAPTGVSKGIKRLVRASRLPSLGRYADVAEYLTRQGYSSESGAETDEEDKAELPQDYVGRNTRVHQKVSIKLHEVGPRVSLALLKVEEGLCDGATLYHSLVSKTDEEAAAAAERVQARAALKAERKQQQQLNVERKRQAAADKAARRKRRRGEMAGGGEEGEEGEEDEEDEDAGGGSRVAQASDAAYVNGNSAAAADDDDDDAEWYRREVGEEPAPELALGGRGGRPNKKRKAEGGGAAPRATQSENERAPPVFAKAAAAARGKMKGGKRGP